MPPELPVPCIWCTGLGLKRGLEEDIVVAPYASMLALMVAPVKAATTFNYYQETGSWGIWFL